MRVYTGVEVLPEKEGGWKIVQHWYEARDHVIPRERGPVLALVVDRTRFKHSAVLIGRATAKVLRTELVVKNRRGQIKQKDSFGNDPEGRG